MFQLSTRHFTILASLVLMLTTVPCLAGDPVLAEPDPTDMRLLRAPDIHGDLVVFSYGGDLWSVSVQGGPATRLTASTGYLQTPKFSPDGDRRCRAVTA